MKKKYLKLICLILIFSMILGSLSIVQAVPVPTDLTPLEIRITNVKEPVADALPRFVYNLEDLNTSDYDWDYFDFCEWLEFNISYESLLDYLDELPDQYCEDLYRLCTKMAINPSLDYSNSDIPELETFSPNKTYAAIFWGEIYEPSIPDVGSQTTVPASLGGVTTTSLNILPATYTFFDITSYVNGKSENVRTFNYHNEVMIVAVYDTTPEPEPEPIVIPTSNIKATVNWNNISKASVPESIVLKLMNGETVVQEKTVTKANAVDNDTWEYTFENVPETDEEGNPLTYTLAYAETNKDDLKFYKTTVNGFTVDNTFIEPEIQSKVKMTSIIDREENNVKYKITFNSTINKYSGDANVVVTTTLPFAIDEAKSKLDGGTYDPKTRSIVWTETISNIDEKANYSLVKNIDIYPTAVLPYAIEAKTVGEVKLTAVADYSESVDTVDNIESTQGNPKTGDENIRKYLSAGVIGFTLIIMVASIKRKYSTKKSRIQF